MDTLAHRLGKTTDGSSDGSCPLTVDVAVSKISEPTRVKSLCIII
jgi:hypothetical protein